MQQLLTEQAVASKTAAITKDIMVIIRVADAVCMRRSQAERALRTGVYQVQTEAKNGKWQKVALSVE
ncbi:MAG TPA: hypothetical protein VNR38_06335 [Ureibacillus sp.]|nr:hypothetical protein [Ureibacillus sp.]